MTLRSVLALALALVVVVTGAHTRLAPVDGPDLLPDTPTRTQVEAARRAARGAATDVASLRTALVVAGQRLESAQDEAARAAESYNGARYRAVLAQQRFRAAARRTARAAGEVGRQRAAYADTVTSSLQLAPELTALAALTSADGIERVVEQLTTLRTTTEALDGGYDSYRATAVLADVARQDARRSRVVAVRSLIDARRARDAAERATDLAAATAASVAAQRDRLLGRLATLQRVSVAVARQRQRGLEMRAAAAAQVAAEQAAEEAAAAAEATVAPAAAPTVAAPVTPTLPPIPIPPSAPTVTATVTAPAAPTVAPTSEPAVAPTPTGEPVPVPVPEPASAPAPAPPPASGASAAIAFARAQVGEPYVYGAAGPGSWDCSGLTMAAWGAGGGSLPHYSVAQYERSTPITLGDLRPGDLVFWGSSSSPGSIYHVALYSGDGQVIQAPRTGRTVYEGSMYDWRTPDFFARP